MQSWIHVVEWRANTRPDLTALVDDRGAAYTYAQLKAEVERKAGGWAGVITAATAWYASAGLTVRGMVGQEVLPLGRPLWTGTTLPIGRRAMPARAR